MIVSRPLTNTESERVGTVRAWTLMEADRGIEPDFHGASSKHRFANWVTDHNPHLLAIHADDDVARVDRSATAGDTSRCVAKNCCLLKS